MNLILAWFFADFITGLVHWFEDRYLDASHYKIIDEIAKDNELHHEKPTAMLLSGWWDNIKLSASVALPVALVMLILGFPHFVYMGVALSSLGNLIHRWSHMPASQLPGWITFMQYTGLFISRKEHDAHHRSMLKLIPKHEAGYKFCTMTNYLNPVLDYFKFWNFLEYVLEYFNIYTIEKRNELRSNSDNNGGDNSNS
jgi:hypothetical protein